MTPGKLVTILPVTLATSLIDGGVHASYSVQAFFKAVAFYPVSCIVIATEFITNPRIVKICVGIKIDFSGCTTKPNLSNNTVMSTKFLTHSS